MKLYLIITILIILQGCTQNDNSPEVSNGYGSGHIKELTLKDGTRCAALIGFKKGGLSCDWRKSNDY